MELSDTRTYEKMLIFINDNVPEGDGSLLKNIQNYIKSASRTLFKATSNLSDTITGTGVKFGKVYIKVPINWNIHSSETITWQQCNRADFFVSLSSNDDTKIITKQLRKCGEPGEFIKFPHKFFLQTNSDSITDPELRKYGKTIVSGFARLRYGVFPETPYQRQLTVFDGKDFVNATCGQNIQWKINNSPALCSDSNDVCTYEILPNQKYQHSLMFDQSTDSNEYFCNGKSRPHNHLANNLHNIKCDSKSVSEIILQHQDFKKYIQATKYADPSFVIVKGQSKNIVLVLDISGSMGSSIDNMKKASIGYVMDIVEPNAFVSIVTFNSYAYTSASLTQMNSLNNRRNLENVLKSLNSNGGTNIPAGLRQAVQVLGGNIENDDNVFGMIILLSDGGNNGEVDKYPRYIKQIIKKGIVVNVIAYGTAADAKLNELASGTGGKFLFASTNLGGDLLELKSKFGAQHSCELKINQTEIIFQGSNSIDINKRIIEKEFMNLDAYVGNNVKVDISFPSVASKYKISLIDSNNLETTPSKSTNQGQKIILTFVLGSSYQNGVYKIRLQRNENLRFKRSLSDQGTMQFTFSVTATKNANKSRNISPTGSISTSDIQMVQPSTTVLALVDLTDCGINDTDETVKVQLLMYKEDSLMKTYDMKDNGLGEDSIYNDKIFSKMIYSTDLKMGGFYSFKSQLSIISNTTENQIKRTIDIGSLRVHNDYVAAVIPDTIPPAQIVSFNIINSSVIEKTVTISFKAVGDNNMEGSINKYEFLIQSGNQSVIKTIQLNEQPGKTIVHILNVKNETIPEVKSFTFQIRGVDNAGNSGQWSMIKYYSWNYEEIKNKNRKKVEDQDKGKELVKMYSWHLVFLILLLIFVQYLF